MKKFIAIALVLAMCLCLFAGCNQGGQTQTDPVETKDPLASAAAYLKTMYKDKAGKVLRDFELVAVVAIDGTKYDIEWTTDASEENVKIVPGDNSKVTIDINEKPAEQVDFTLTATIKDASGKTASASLSFYIEAVEPEAVGATFVDAPVVGTAYKYALVQATKGVTLYFTGEMDGFYLAMSEDPAAGVDVTVEAAEGGYYISFTKDGAKKYIDIVPREGAEGKVNVVIADAPTAVYTWDAERKTMTTKDKISGENWYLGTYGEYTTISASKISYIEDVTKIGVSQFPAGFATVGSTAPVFVDTPAVGTAYKYALVQATKGVTLFFTGEMDGFYLAMSESTADGVDVKLEAAEGGYYISFTKDGAKKYIDIVPREGAEGKVNVVIADAPTAVYTWDAERKTMTTKDKISGENWYLGTYGEYTTISASKISYIEDVTKIGVSQFPACFATVSGVSTPVVTPDKEENKNDATEPSTEATEPSTDATEPSTGTTTPPAADVTLANGMKVVIYVPSHGKALSSQPASEGSYYQKGVDVTVAGGVVSGYADTEVWTVVANSDGTYSFEIGGKKLGMQDSFSSMSLGSVNDKWEVISLGNGLYNIKNVVRGNYIEWYNDKGNWSTYTTDNVATNELFQLSIFVVG